MSEQPVMTLEEVIAAMRETLRKRQIWLDAGHWSLECQNEVQHLTAALHHLESGKRARLQALEEVESILEAEPLGYRTEGEHMVTEKLMDRLVAKVRTLSLTPPQQA